MPRGWRRFAIAVLFFVDATLLGLLHGQGILNQIDQILGNGLPNDLVWILQIVEAISAGFAFVKIIFDDIKPGMARNVAIALSPLLLLLIVFFTLEILLQGLDSRASIVLDMVSIGTNTLIWSSTYLAIALGLTLTYKVQRYGNFAQSEFFMVGMFLAMVIAWSDYYSPIYEAPADGVIAWSLLLRVLVFAFVCTGLVGVMIDILVYRGFRLRKATPQVMMIASLGIALILRALFFLRFGSSRNIFEPDGDIRISNMSWKIPTQKLKINLGNRDLRASEDANGNGVFDVETYTQAHANAGEIPVGAAIGDIIPGTGEDLDGDGRFDSNPETYTHGICEQSADAETGELLFDETTGEPLYQRTVSEGWSPENTIDGSRPTYELYDMASDCVSQAITTYPFHKGIVPFVLFSAAILLYLLLTKTRLGRKMRAVADNPDLAASSGINVEKIQLTSAFLSAGITGLGGAVFAMTFLFNPSTAFILLLPSFAVIVLGTIGSVPGTIFAALIVGFIRAISYPVLVGIGSPLDRPSYSQMADVMPYIFLIAILMIMPLGIGDAWEKWKIERLRKKSSKDSAPSRKVAAVLAILPTGIFGLHHWWLNRSDRAQSFSAIAIGAYVLHRISKFLGTHSFADGACAEACLDSTSAETNLAVLTGRGDGTLLVEDSPYFSEAVSDLDASWFELMQTELQVTNLIVDLGEYVWPLIPILLWALALIEMNRLLSNDNTSSKKSSPEHKNLFAALKMPNFDDLRNRWLEIDRKHQSLISDISERLAGFGQQASSTISSANSWIIDTVSWGSEERSTHLRKYGREGATGSWLAFGVLLFTMLLFLWWLPISDDVDNLNWSKAFQVSNVLLTLSIFLLMTFSLNLHTGITGMVNFGVIFFVGIGAITVTVLTAPVEMHGHGWDILPATILAIFLSAAFGWGLAYPTARLRMDYFAIVTISLGEIVRVLLSGEPLLRTGPIVSGVGIGNYPLPLKQWWFCGSSTEVGPDKLYISADSCRNDILLSSPASSVSDLLNLGDPAPYFFLLATIGITLCILIWILLDTLLASPWGRILKAIREDEDVAQHHGHNVLTNKAASLALGAAIAALAGALWAWKLTGFDASFMSPAKSTFLVWAAFIIGGAANNRGMVIGAFIIVLMEFLFNVLVAASTSDLPLYSTTFQIDSLYRWLITSQWGVTKTFLILTVIGLAIRSRAIIETGVWGTIVFAFTAIFLGEKSIEIATNFEGNVSILGPSMAYVKLLLIGALMLFSLKYNPKGLLPEVPSRPLRPSEHPLNTESGGDTQ